MSFTTLFEPTRQQVVDTLAEVAKQAKVSRQPVVVYWAGHSHYDEKNNRLLLFPIDAEVITEKPEYAFKNEIDFSADFLRILPADVKLLFLGDGFNIGEGLVGQVANQYPNLVVFSSAKIDEEVLDQVPGLNHGALAYFLAQALQEPIKDLDGDGLLSVDDIYMHVYPRVVEAFLQVLTQLFPTSYGVRALFA